MVPSQQQMAPAPDSTPPAPAPAKKDKTTSRGLPPNIARIVVDLPADAKLYVDDQPMQSTSSRRVFRTPILEPEQTYYYDLRAEMVRDGKAYTQSKRILVRAGEEMRVGLGDQGLMAVALGEQSRR
jgi:uncharacterized protein (TIGR03000 family)